jgi:hypothetical protein
MPNGTSTAFGATSWSRAFTGPAPRAAPPREKSPTSTFALVWSEILSASGSAAVRAWVSWTWVKMASVWGTFFLGRQSRLVELVFQVF